MRRIPRLWIASVVVSFAGGAYGQSETNLLTNGSFEFWSRYAKEVLPDALANGPAFDSADPLIPVRWSWNLRKPATMERSEDAHGGKYAVAIAAPGGGGLRLASLEVVPDATYSFGIWAKGAGDVNIRILGNAPEGQQEVAKFSGKAAANWARLGSDNGGRTAAILYSLIATAKRHGLDPFAYLRDVIAPISDRPSSRLDELLPDQWKPAPASV